MTTFQKRLTALLLLSPFLLSLATAFAQPASQTIFVAFDIETTGFSTTRDRIVEIGAVRFQAGRRKAVTNWLINPQQPIPKHATRVHGITDAMVASAPTFSAVYPAFRAFVKDATLLAHNARFDAGFLAAAIRRADLPALDNTIIDTLTLARDQFPNLSSHRLDQLATTLTLPHTNPHRAGSDAITVMHLMLHILDTIPPATTRQALIDTAALLKPAARP